MNSIDTSPRDPQKQWKTRLIKCVIVDHSMVYKSFPIVTKPVQKPHLLCAPRTQRIPPDPWVTMKEPLLSNNSAGTCAAISCTGSHLDQIYIRLQLSYDQLKRKKALKILVLGYSSSLYRTWRSKKKCSQLGLLLTVILKQISLVAWIN